MEQKRISFMLDVDSYTRWQQIAKEEYRSIPKQTMITVKAYIAQYDQGKREPSSEDAY